VRCVPAADAYVGRRKMMNCPKCNESLNAQAFLDACRVSWPNQGWSLLYCPLCHVESHVRIHDGMIQTGNLDGAPGPCFEVDGTIRVPGLKVARSASGLQVELGQYKRVIPVKT
jgi:hypothetical protein